jgi:hypothetical protein
MAPSPQFSPYARHARLHRSWASAAGHPLFSPDFGGGKSTKLRDGCLSRSCLPVPAQRGHTEPSTQGDAKTMSRTTNCGWDRRIFSSGAMQTYISFSVLRRKRRRAYCNLLGSRATSSMHPLCAPTAVAMASLGHRGHAERRHRRGRTALDFHRYDRAANFFGMHGTW